MGSLARSPRSADLRALRAPGVRAFWDVRSVRVRNLECVAEPELTRLMDVGRVDIPVLDRDAAIAFYTGRLGFSLVIDTPFGDDRRWVEVAPPAGGPTIALVEPTDDFPVGRMTGVVLTSADPEADHASLKAAAVDVDETIIGGDGTIPLLFFFRDNSGSQLMVVERQ